MAILRHFTEIAVLAAFDDHQFSIGDLLGKDLRRRHMITGPPITDILASDDDQRRRFDLVYELRCLMALPGDNMAQITLERRDLLEMRSWNFFTTSGCSRTNSSVNMNPGPQ